MIKRIPTRTRGNKLINGDIIRFWATPGYARIDSMRAYQGKLYKENEAKIVTLTGLANVKQLELTIVMDDYYDRF